MRYIISKPYISEGLNNAHAVPPADDSQARERWRKFKPHKKKLLQHLLENQYQICCYSELRADELGLGYHIEHVINKGMMPQRTFDYSNLSASAIHSEQITSLPKGQVFGGHARGKTDIFDQALFVSCYDADCARFFAYLSDGRIVPREILNKEDKERAQYTIELLNLDSPFLRVLRKNWWDALDEGLEEYTNDGLDYNLLVQQDLLPIGGRLNSFFSMTRSFYGILAENTLAEKAPELL